MATTDTVRGELVERQNGAVAQTDGPPTLFQYLESIKGEMARALPAHMSADRMARIVLTLIRRTKNLDKVTLPSMGGAVMTCTQLGLEPGVGGECWILPYRNSARNVYEAQLIIGYQGMVKLFWQSPLAKSLDAQAVYKNDQFDYAYGLEPRLVHKPLLSGDRGEPYAYYAVATTTSGGSAFVVMSVEDIEKIRKRSQAKDDGPWKTDYDAMAKKTCLRQLFKLLPKSTAIQHALMHDENIRTDRSIEAFDVEPRYIQIEQGGDDNPPADDQGADPATGEIKDSEGGTKSPPSSDTPATEGAATAADPSPSVAGQPDADQLPIEDPPAEDPNRCSVRGCVDPGSHDRDGHVAWLRSRRQGTP